MTVVVSGEDEAATGLRIVWEGAGQCWSVAPGRAGEHHCTPAWCVLPRVLDDYTFWFVRGGRAELRCAGRVYPMAAGDLLLVPPGVEHSANHDPAHPLWTVTAHFTFIGPLGEPLPPPDPIPPVHRSLSDAMVVDAHLDRLLAMLALRPPGWLAIARILFLAILTELWREDAQAALSPGQCRGAYPVIARALLNLETTGQYFTRPGALAAACNVSIGHFSRIFRRQFGCTPHQYLVRRRIERARHLLLESDLSVQQIAHSLGYHDVYFFTRQFKALVRQPPATFRRLARGPS